MLIRIYLFLYIQFASALSSVDEIMNKLLKIRPETLFSWHGLSVQFLLCGNFQTFFEEDILFQVFIS